MVWYVYVLQCEDDSLYCGSSNDVERRVAEHQAGTGRAAKYTRAHRPKHLIAVWTYDNRSQALRAERMFKKLTRAQKLVIVHEHWEDWHGGKRRIL